MADDQVEPTAGELALAKSITLEVLVMMAIVPLVQRRVVDAGVEALREDLHIAARAIGEQAAGYSPGVTAATRIYADQLLRRIEHLGQQTSAMQERAAAGPGTQ